LEICLNKSFFIHEDMLDSQGTLAKAVIPTNRGISITIIGAICEKGTVDLTLRRPKAVEKSNKRERLPKMVNQFKKPMPE
jgi:hypothetical protein